LFEETTPNLNVPPLAFAFDIVCFFLVLTHIRVTGDPIGWCSRSRGESVTRSAASARNARREQSAWDVRICMINYRGSLD
jgi:hypothetical protein